VGITASPRTEPPLEKQAQGGFRLPHDIREDLDSLPGQLIQAEGVNAATDDLVHFRGDQMVQSLRETQMRHGEVLLADEFTFLKKDDPHFRGEVETGRNSISEKGNGYFHTHPEI
jgi:hypothetical protein